MSFFMDCEIMPEERRYGHVLEIRRLDTKLRTEGWKYQRKTFPCCHTMPSKGLKDGGHSDGGQGRTSSFQKALQLGGEDVQKNADGRC